MRRGPRSAAVAALVACLLAAAALPVVELASGARGATSQPLANPCHPRTFGGSGLDGAVQQTALDGLDGAACRLGISREQLVLSLASGGSQAPPHWDAHAIEVALRAGAVGALKGAAARVKLPSGLAPLLRNAIHQAPLDQLVRGAISLGNLIG